MSPAKGQAWSVKPREVAREHTAEVQQEQRRHAERRPSWAEAEAAAEATDVEPSEEIPQPSAWTVPWAAFRALIDWYEIRGDQRMARLLELEMETVAGAKKRMRECLESLAEADG